ncbi:hypothetical protein T492DRAFT_591928 [Pavlovales sp. CCMP2436]|nr:hypothetical protein T492DRAFT_591928 [Pavlovales sp. CCMP2436]
MHLLGAAAIPRISSFTAQSLVTTAWAFATLGIGEPRLSDAIARASEQRIGEFKPQELANTAWAFATLGISEPRLFDAIARASEQHIGDFSAQGLANTAWAFATLGISEPRFLDAIARTSEQRIGDFNPQDLANTAWAFATLGISEPRLFDAIARASEQSIRDYRAGPGQHRVGVCSCRVELELRPPAELLAPIGLRDACKQAIADEPTASSKLHLEVSAELTRMGIAHKNELCLPKLGYLAVRTATGTYGGLVIEVHGPSHYDAAQRLLPATELIRRHLALVGCAVVAVPYWKWDALGGHAEKAAYLAELLSSLPPLASSRASESRGG